MKRIYLDYAASTPADKRVMAAMAPYFSEKFGNPGSLHREGQVASAAVFNARLKIARALGCDYRETIFTAGATEANNLALRGIMKKFEIRNSKSETRNPKFEIRNLKIIISAIEHESIAETAADLERDGVEVAVIPVSKEGFVDLEKLKAALDERTILVSVMYANNEVGTIQPISKIANIIREYKQGKIATQGLAMTAGGGYPLFHTDAAQAFQYLPCRPEELGVDLMTLSSHKIYGPKGIGMLYIKETLRQAQGINHLITGGEQEWAMRAGTENTPYIVGFAEAIEIAEKMREKEAKRVGKLRDYFWNKIKETLRLRSGNKNNYPVSLSNCYANVELNGSVQNRLPNNLNVYFPGRKAQDLLIALDINGIAASSGSACSAHTTEPSRVIMELGHSRERAMSSLRFTLGRQTKRVDIDKTVSGLLKYL